jgi:hypothetical protein
VCAFFRNEAPHLLEWIVFHRQMGVTDFFLYDHNSKDNYIEVLQPLVDKGIVHLYVNGNMQMAQMDRAAQFQGHAIHHCAQNHRDSVDWLMHIDIDEFLTPAVAAQPGKTYIETVFEPLQQTNITGVYVFRFEFGPNNHRVAPANMLQCEAYTTRSSSVNIAPKWIFKYVRMRRHICAFASASPYARLLKMRIMYTFGMSKRFTIRTGRLRQRLIMEDMSSDEVCCRSTVILPPFAVAPTGALFRAILQPS